MQHPIHLNTLNDEIITSSHKALLPMTQLPLKARETIIFLKLKKALLWISTFGNNRYVFTFNINEVNIIESISNEAILQGTRDKSNGLYLVDMKSNEIMTELKPDTSLANHIYEKRSNRNLVMYYYRGGPAKATWIATIKGINLQHGLDSQQNSSRNTYRDLSTQ